MELAVAIVEVSKVRSTKTGKQLADLKVQELSTSAIYTVACFVNSEGFPFNIGDHVTMEITVSEWQGKKQYSTGLKGISPMEKPKEKDKNGVPLETWENKDLRMARQNALRHAVNTIGMALGESVKELKPSELTNMIIMEADQYVQYIYEGDKSVKMAGPEVE